MNFESISNKHVRDEYRRWVEIIGPADPYEGKYSIGIHECIHAHFLLVDFFNKIGEGIGGVGPKDLNLLHSALSRQFVEFGGKPKYKNRIDICGTLMYGLIKNHPFYDANKRTSFLVSVLHLQKVGRSPTATHGEYEDFTVDISNNNLEKYLSKDIKEEKSPEREIEIISRFLKKKTRNIDLKSKTITYNELQTLIGKRGMRLENPKGNRIDVVKFKDEHGNDMGRSKRIAHIGFHGWSKQVSQTDISRVREASRLDARHGYDSQSFFNGLDDPLTLIRKYKEPLERLAFR